VNVHLICLSWLNTQCLTLTRWILKYLEKIWLCVKSSPKFIHFTALRQCGFTWCLLLCWSPKIIPTINLGELSSISMTMTWCWNLVAQLPNLNKHSLEALSRLPGRSISGAPPPRSIQTLIRTCRKKTPLFWNWYQPDTHYIVPVNSTVLLWKILNHRKVKLERQVNKISYSGQPSFAATSRDNWHWHTSTGVWDHVCRHWC